MIILLGKHFQKLNVAFDGAVDSTLTSRLQGSQLENKPL